MRSFWVYLLFSLLHVPTALAGEWQDGPAPVPAPPQIVDPALGLPSPWRYIDGEGVSTSPCLGETSTPSCLYDTMVACGSWTPHWSKLEEGAPGYPYGPDWKGGLHPLCDPLRWTPVPDYDVRETEPLGLMYQSLIDPPENRVFFYRAYAFLVDGRIVPRSRDQLPLARRVGDLVIVGIHYFCSDEIAETLDYSALIKDDPHAEVLWQRLPEGCDEWTNTHALVMREHDKGWWVVYPHVMQTGARGAPAWDQAYAFYLSIRK
jgi:hypothetical protein